MIQGTTALLSVNSSCSRAGNWGSDPVSWGTGELGPQYSLPGGTRPISLLSAGGLYLLGAVRCIFDHQCTRLWGSSRQDSEPVSIYCQSLRETTCNLGTE